MNYSYGLRPAVSLKPDTKVSGGDGTTANPYIIDPIKPSVTITSNKSNNNSPVLLDNLIKNQYSVTINAVDNESGLSSSNKYQYCLPTSSTSVTGCTWVPYVSGTSFNVSISGKRYLWIYPVKDNAGNINGDNSDINIPYLIKSFESFEIPLDNVASTYVTSSTGIDFGVAPSDTNGKGLYIKSGTENNTNPIYYYRGEIDNNNVIFGKYCWKIVRTTETGGIKLIYNGVPIDEVCNNTGDASQIGTSAFNLNASSPADVGYMYGTRYEASSKDALDITTGMVFGNDVTYLNETYTLTDTYTSANGWATDRTTIGSKYHYTCFTTGTTCSTVYYVHYSGTSSYAYYMTLTDGKKINDILKEMTTESTNENDSTIKTNIDTWYKDNMTEYTSYLEDAIWCNDRSIYKLNGWDKDTSASSYLYFGAYGRNTSSPYKPSLDCPSKNDSFTVGSSGNGKLIYPVGLLTADEAIIVGHYWNEQSNNIGVHWLLISPSDFLPVSAAGFFVKFNGYLGSGTLNHYFQIRPAISLKSNTKVSSGDGTVNSPYIVVTN